MSEQKQEVKTVVARVELKVPYSTIVPQRKKGEKTRSAGSKGNVGSYLKETFTIQKAIPLAELSKRIEEAVSVLNNGVKTKGTPKEKEAALRKAITKEVTDKLLLEQNDIVDGYIKAEEVLVEEKNELTKENEALAGEIKRLDLILEENGLSVDDVLTEIPEDDAPEIKVLTDEDGQPIKPTKPPKG